MADLMSDPYEISAADIVIGPEVYRGPQYVANTAVYAGTTVRVLVRAIPFVNNVYLSMYCGRGIALLQVLRRPCSLNRR